MSDPVQPSGPVSLRAEHAQLDQRFVDLCECARLGTWHEVDELWPSFSGALERHMQHEETELFPAFSQAPEGLDRTAELRSEHTVLRRQVEAIGIELQLHALRPESILALVASLRAHAAREEEVFYPWLAHRELAEAAARAG